MIDKVKSLQNSEIGETQGDRQWLDATLSCGDDYEPYEWGDLDPLTLGKPVKYLSEQGFVVEGGKDIVRSSSN
ncbi:hypothetical protein [Spirulina sp. 06S082]|uniref:hypothetical protein n=1 Tax=Spirulina sp. 06S082 TaxID=3110248 RepID=UPI002B2078E3|nr:hypothetical protein [Spirulina sp. 06S082]MEA5468921.1 hypothetical protein [Spirulina sp. 06S082]